MIPVWDRILATTLSCLDETFRRIGGIATYTLTDNEKTITSEHIAGSRSAIPTWPQPDAITAPRSSRVSRPIRKSKGGSEATVRIAKADLVPTDANLRDRYTSFAELRAEAAVFCDTVNGRVHRETRQIPSDMLIEELARLHPVPVDPYVAALGETRQVNRSSVVSWGGTRYSVPHILIDEQVYVRIDGDELVVAHQGRDGVTEVARHRTAPPGQPQLDLSHYPPRSASRILEATPSLARQTKQHSSHSARARLPG